MNEFAAWIVIIGIIFLAFMAWRFYCDEKNERDKRSAWWKELSLKVEDAKTVAKSALALATDAHASKLDMSRRIVDGNTKVKDLEIEIHNLQDHLSRNDKDVIDLNRTFSKLRPIHKIVLPRVEVGEKLKPKAKSKSRSH